MLRNIRITKADNYDNLLNFSSRTHSLRYLNTNFRVQIERLRSEDLKNENPGNNKQSTKAFNYSFNYLIILHFDSKVSILDLLQLYRIICDIFHSIVLLYELFYDIFEE